MNSAKELSISQAAELLGVSRTQIYRLLEEDKIPSLRPQDLRDQLMKSVVREYSDTVAQLMHKLIEQQE